MYFFRHLIIIEVSIFVLGSCSRAISLSEIVNSRTAPRKILLSATLSKDVEELHQWNLHKPRLFRANVDEAKEVLFSVVLMWRILSEGYFLVDIYL